jgi:hypothetical protein
MWVVGWFQVLISNGMENSELLVVDRDLPVEGLLGVVWAVSG